MNTHLNQEQISKLRTLGLISEEEVAFVSGDLIVVENVINKSRRILENGKTILNESRRGLKG